MIPRILSKDIPIHRSRFVVKIRATPISMSSLMFISPFFWCGRRDDKPRRSLMKLEWWGKQRNGVFNDEIRWIGRCSNHLLQYHRSRWFAIRDDASFVTIVIGIGSSGVDPSSFPCILVTRYRFVGTPFWPYIDLYHDYRIDDLKNREEIVITEIVRWISDRNEMNSRKRQKWTASWK